MHLPSPAKRRDDQLGAPPGSSHGPITPVCRHWGPFLPLCFLIFRQSLRWNAEGWASPPTTTTTTTSAKRNQAPKFSSFQSKSSSSSFPYNAGRSRSRPCLIRYVITWGHTPTDTPTFHVRRLSPIPSAPALSLPQTSCRSSPTGTLVWCGRTRQALLFARARRCQQPIDDTHNSGLDLTTYLGRQSTAAARQGKGQPAHWPRPWRPSRLAQSVFLSANQRTCVGNPVRICTSKATASAIT